MPLQKKNKPKTNQKPKTNKKQLGHKSEGTSQLKQDYVLRA